MTPPTVIELSQQVEGVMDQRPHRPSFEHSDCLYIIYHIIYYIMRIVISVSILIHYVPGMATSTAR